MVSEKKIFYGFPIISLWELMGPRAWANLDPRDLIGRIYVVDNYTLLHTKYISSGPHGYREFFFKVFPIISLWQLMLPRMWPIRTLGA